VNFKHCRCDEGVTGHQPPPVPTLCLPLEESQGASGQWEVHRPSGSATSTGVGNTGLPGLPCRRTCGQPGSTLLLQPGREVAGLSYWCPSPPVIELKQV